MGVPVGHPAGGPPAGIAEFGPPGTSLGEPAGEEVAEEVQSYPLEAGGLGSPGEGSASVGDRAEDQGCHGSNIGPLPLGRGERQYIEARVGSNNYRGGEVRFIIDRRGIIYEYA